jgi:hypothetical protein
MGDFEFTPEQEFANMIMAMTEAEFNAWADKMSLEEIERATYTIKKASLQLKEQMDAYIEEEECAIEEEIFNGNLDDAQSVLSKFTLKGVIMPGVTIVTVE